MSDDLEHTEQETTPTPTEPTALNTARLSIVDQIAEKREAEFARESGIEPEAPTPDTQVAAALADDESFVPPEMLSRKVKLKIDGQETETTLDQLVRDAQKFSAANQRLQEATELLRAATQAATKPPETVATVPPSPAEHLPPEAVKQKVKAALQAVFNGDEDAAAEQLAAVLMQPAPPRAPDVNVDEIAEVATRKLDERSALKKFFETYPKIAEHQYVQGRADQFFAHFSQQGQSFEQALMSAGEALYKELGWQPTAAPETPTTTRRSQDLAARKAALDTPTSRTMSAATNAAVPESSEEDRSEIIREMAARRNPTFAALQKAGR